MKIKHYTPNGWKRISLLEVAKIQTGIAKGKKNILDPVECPYLRVANVQDGHFDLSEIKSIIVSSSDIERYSIQSGDVLMTEGGDFDKLGRGFVWEEEVSGCLHQNHVFAVRPNEKILDSYFLSYQAGSSYGKRYFRSCSKQSTNLASINSTQLKEYPVLLPTLKEQRDIVDVVKKWDRLIEIKSNILSKKKLSRKALMYQLLTGKRRFPEFVKSNKKTKTRWVDIPVDWEYPRIGEIANVYSVKNTAANDYPVLSCTKHYGLVDSLSYFGKQVFSKDLSTYKIVKRKQFAYATNHIEEGSIGYQDLYDEAVISPMYTVFETNDRVNDRFLFLLLKTELYRHIFESNTSKTVDRRGSLRWKDFSLINIPLPSLQEQQAIVRLFEMVDKELYLLDQQLNAYKEQKKGLMQQLLTGKIRVNVKQATSGSEVMSSCMK